MKYLIVILIAVTTTAAHPERERRSIWGWPAVAPLAPAAAVISPKAGPTAVIGPNGGAVVAAAAPAVVAARVPGAVVAHGIPLAGTVLSPHVW